MKLLTQADDFGFTRANTYGIIDSIDLGILRNTGLFANSEWAEWACSFMKDRPHVSFGIDFNLVSGPSVLPHSEIPHLTDENNVFHKSNWYLGQEEYQTKEGRAKLFPLDEVQKELWAQYERFIKLAGFKPAYTNAHSLCPETYVDTILDISKKEGLYYTDEAIEKFDIKGLPEDMSMPGGDKPKKKTFDYEGQVNIDVVQTYLDNSEYFLKQDISMFWSHPGYVDGQLFDSTTLSFRRFREAQSMMDPRILSWVKDNNIELINYGDLK